MRAWTMRSMRHVFRPGTPLVTAWIALILSLGLAPTLAAQDASGWVGKRVILQFDSVLRVGKDAVDHQKLEAPGRGTRRNTYRVYRVGQVDGRWLRIKAENEDIAG